VKKLIFVLAAVIAVGLVFTGAVLAQEKAKTPEQPQINPEEMAAWQKAATPGPHHKHFAEMAGTWKAECTMWMAPGAEPMKADLKATCESVYDGRYGVERIEGVMMGMPFMGTSINGFDNLKGKHTMVWFDNMSTGTVYSEGECSENCTVETYVYTQKDAMTGKDLKIKMVSRIVDKDHHVLDSYMIGEDGKEFKQMEIKYSRM